MGNLVVSAGTLIAGAEANDHRACNEAARDFVEQVTFAAADDIIGMLQQVLAVDWMALPPWARNLSYRLACLQRPDDVELLREAAADLLSFGRTGTRTWERLRAEADRIERQR